MLRSDVTRDQMASLLVEVDGVGVADAMVFSLR